MSSTKWKLARMLAPVGLVPLFACLGPPVESPRTTVTQETSVRVEQSIKNKVDVLFMVDNSISMAPMQSELQKRFGDFFQVFVDLAASGTYADMHIGVVTSDYGAGDLAGGGCEAASGGQGGKLQKTPSPFASPQPSGCQATTKPYIEYAFT